jgi:hypothetical protein
MKKHDRLWQDLNNLLAFLESYGTVEKLVKEYFSQPNNDNPPKNVPKLVEEYFAKYGNDAPPQILRSYIDKLQKHLDEAMS